MRRLPIVILLSAVISVSSCKVASASMVTVTESGEVRWNVLSDEDELTPENMDRSYIEVKKVAEEKPGDSTQILLAKEDDKISLTLTTDNRTKTMDVSGWSSDLIEIEERKDVQRVQVALEGDQFSIINNGIKAITSLPLVIDSDTSEISLKTSTGEGYLLVFPYEAVESLIKTKIINRLPGKMVSIVEENGDLVYKIDGFKVFNLFDLYEYEVPIKSNVSAATGEILYIDAPGWLKVINYLFS